MTPGFGYTARMQPMAIIAWVAAAAALIGGIVLWRAGSTFVGSGLIAISICLGLAVILAPRRGGDEEGGLIEPERFEQLDPQRCQELIRGTSMHLRDLRYRYSVRQDRGSRTPFTAEVNTVILGFAPVIIMDNHTDRQGMGYVAFPYDGRRWRGPGLPCGGSQEEAIAHASRCVAPIEDEPRKPTRASMESHEPTDEELDEIAREFDRAIEEGFDFDDDHDDDDDQDDFDDDDDGGNVPIPKGP